MRRVIHIVGGVLVAAIALALLWTHTPLKGMITRENAAAIADSFSGYWWAPLVVMASYTPACMVMFPRPLITLAAVIAFGPWLGFLYALVGIVGSSIVTYCVGKRMRRDTVRRLP